MPISAGAIVATLDLDASTFTTKLRRADRDVELFSGRLQKVGQGFGSGLAVALPNIDRQLGRLDRTVAGLHSRWLGLGQIMAATTFAAAAGQAVKAGEAMIQLDRQLGMVEASLRKTGAEVVTADEQFAWLQDTALRTGANFDELGKAWVRLSISGAGAGVSMETIREALVGTLGAGAAMGSTAVQVSRVLQGMSQVAGKGTLQMEEMKQQLGEGLPVAMAITAKGLGVTTEKLMEMTAKGQVTADEFFGAWAEGAKQFQQFGPLFAASISGALQNARTILRIGVGDLMVDGGINDALAGTMMTVNDGLAEMLKQANSSADGIGAAFIDSAETITTAFVNSWNVVAPTLKGIYDAAADVTNGALRTYLDLPPEVREWGVIGAMLLGASPLRIVAMLAAMSEGAGITGVAKAYMEGDQAESTIKSQSFGGGIKMTSSALGAAYGADVGQAFQEGDYAGRLKLLDEQIAQEQQRVVELQAAIAGSTDSSQLDRLSGQLAQREGAIEWLGNVRTGVERYQAPLDVKFSPLSGEDWSGWSIPDPAGTFDSIRANAAKAREARGTEIEGIDLGTAAAGAGTDLTGDARRKLIREMNRELGEHLSIANAVRDSYADADQALVTLWTNRAEFDVRAADEQDRIAKGLLDQGAALFTLTEAQIAEKAVKGELMEIDTERARIALDLQHLGNADVSRAEQLLHLDLMRLRTEQERQQTALMSEPAYAAQWMAQQLEAQRQEHANLALKLQLAQSPAYQEQEFQNAVMADELAMAELYYSYSLDMEQRLQTMRAEGIAGFTDDFAAGISSIVKGQESIGEAFTGMMRSMIGGIIDFFAQWIAEWIAMQMIQLAFGRTMQAASVGMAATQATAMTAIWATPATLASIATFGGAVAAGTSSMLLGVGSTFGTLMGMQAANAAAGAAGGVYHDGGLVDEFMFTGLPGMKPDEGLALLQEGEFVLSRDMVQGFSGLPDLTGEFNSSGNYQSTLSTAGDYIDERELRETRLDVNVIATLDPAEIHREFRRNPGTVAGIVLEDHRNRGPISQRQRRG